MGVGLDKTAAKKLLISIVHMALPQSNLPFLWNLALEMKKAVVLLLAFPQFQYLSGKFPDRRDPVATRLHFALANIENQIMTDAEAELKRQVKSVQFNTYMFDGAVIRTHPDDVSRVALVLGEVGERHRVKFTITSFQDILGSASV